MSNYYYVPTKDTKIITTDRGFCEGRNCPNKAEFLIYPKGMKPRISEFFTGGALENVSFCRECAEKRGFDLPLGNPNCACLNKDCRHSFYQNKEYWKVPQLQKLICPKCGSDLIATSFNKHIRN